MKRLVLAFFGIALLLSNLAAHAASATFATRNGAIFQLFINGRSVNGPGSATVRIDRLPAGPQNLEFRIPARRGAMVFNTRIFLERGFETNYVLVLPGYTPNFTLKKVSKIPQRPIGNYPNYGNGNGHNHDPYDDYDYDNLAPQENLPPATNYGNKDNYNNAPAAPYIMNRYDVDLLAESISKLNFDSSKMDIAEQALSNTTILSEDLKRILRLFTFDSNRVEFAKFAYSRVADPQNFYRVYDAFDYDSSVSDMQRWLKQ